MFHFTSRRLVAALAARARDGVSVRVLLDSGQADPDLVTALRRGGAVVRLVTAGERARFHHKYAVLDGRIVVTGSYNWTVMGDIANHENLVVLRHRGAARAFEENFDRTWNDGALSHP